MLANRRTKIVATIGPSSNSEDGIRQAIMSGMNVARLNFSHGNHEDHRQVIQAVRKVSKELKAPVGILQDLQGPKIRVGKLKDGQILLKSGDHVVISPDFELGEGDKISTDFVELPEVCQPGTRILLDDGLLEVRAERVEGRNVYCEVIFGGILKDRKGMNLPDVDLPVDCLTPKDLADLEFGLEHNVDYVALSFVRRGSDIKKLRELIDQKNPAISIIAKIEMKGAIDNLEEIVSLADGVMVARGDLAVEVGQTTLPAAQKKIINICNKNSKPVITATQMLESMVENPRPTRAEITDVANAVLDGSDALMLSAESASGKYPFKAISTMHEIIEEVEKSGRLYYDIPNKGLMSIPDSIAVSACVCAQKLNAAAIVCLTTTGKTAIKISSFRPKARIIAVTDKLDTLNRLEAAWGIQTFSIGLHRSADDAMSRVEKILVDYGLAQEGDKVILSLGMPVHHGATTNTLRVYQVSRTPIELAPGEIPYRCLPYKKP